MLRPGKPIVFSLLSALIHLLFALFFTHVTLSFAPPAAKKMALVLTTDTRGASDIIRKEAVWISPSPPEPGFPVDEVLSTLEAEIPFWLHMDQPENTLFAPREALVPILKIESEAEKLRPQPPADFFSPLPAEEKPMPSADFALGPDQPELSGRD